MVQARAKVAKTDQALVTTCWQMGRYIVEYEQKTRYRATQIKAAVAVNSALIEFYWNAFSHLHWSSENATIQAI